MDQVVRLESFELQVSRMTALKFAASLSLLAVSIVGCGNEPAKSENDAKTTAAATPSGGKSGTVATDFTTRDLEGKTVRLGEYLGKKAILLDFWTTFCDPCLHELPHLRKLYEANKDKGFVVVAVSMDGPDTVGQVPDFAKRNRMTFPVWLDEDSHVSNIYNPKKSAPLSVLINREGKVVRIHEGFNAGDEEVLAKEVEAILSQK